MAETSVLRPTVSPGVERLRAVRDHLSKLVDRVEKQHERVTITRNGRAAAVLISPEDLAELEETLSVLAPPAALADMREADRGAAATPARQHREVEEAKAPVTLPGLVFLREDLQPYHPDRLRKLFQAAARRAGCR